MHRRLRLLLVAAAALAVLASSALAEETRIAVRVLAKDAKFIGTSMGGARVTLRDADTGELLAQGLTQGSTGDTARIMKEPWERGKALSTEGSAAFLTTLDLDAPRRIRFTAVGPLAQLQATNEVSATQWVVPGRHLDGGDGILLVMPGFVVDVLAPPAHVRMGGVPHEIEIRANLTMTCGCPTEPGGLWDSEGWELTAWIVRDGERIAEVPLAFLGETSQFGATWTAAEPGVYEILVFAWDPANGNTGLDRTTVIVTGS